MVIVPHWFDDAGKVAIAEAAKEIGGLLPTMPSGRQPHLQTAGSRLRVLADGFDVEIIEAHHRAQRWIAPPALVHGRSFTTPLGFAT